MKEYLVKNTQTNKYYNFITKSWVTYPTYACLTLNDTKINELLVNNCIEIVPCINLNERNNVVDEVLVFA